MTARRPADGWCEVQEAELFFWAGTDVLSVVAEKYNRWAKLNGYLTRTEVAITTKLHSSGYSVRPSENGWSAKSLSQLLGLTPWRVQGWIRAGLLKAEKHGPNYRITRSQFQAFARARPELLAAIHPGCLAQVLTDWQIEEVRATTPKWAQNVPVRSVKTGKTYSTIKEAARAENCTASFAARLSREGRCSTSGHGFVKLFGEVSA